MKMLEPGSRLGPYRIESVISEGADLTLYRARQEELDRDVALYVARSSTSEQNARFLRTAAAAARLEDPRILPIFDVGAVDDAAYAGGRLLAAPTLADLQHDGPLGAERVVRLGDQLAPALEALERAGLGVSTLSPNAVLINGEEAYLAPLQAELDEGGSGADAASALAGLLTTSLSTPSGEHAVPPGLMEELSRPHPTPSALMDAVNAALPRSRPPARRATMAVAAGVLLVAIAAVVTALAVHGGGNQSKTRAPVAAAAPAGRVIARVPLGASPIVALAAGGWVWVGTREGKLLRVDPHTRQLVGAPVKIGGEIGALAASGGSLFVASATGVAQVSAATGRVHTHRRLTGQLLDLKVAGRTLWVTRVVGARYGEFGFATTTKRFASFDLVQLDASTLRERGRPIALRYPATGIAVRAGTVWLTDPLLGTMTRVDSRTAAQRSIEAVSRGSAPVFDGDQLWLAAPDLAAIISLNPVTMQLSEDVVRAGHPGSLTLAGGALWATSTEGARGVTRLYRIAPRARRVAGSPVDLGPGIVHSFDSIAVAEGVLWVPSLARHTLVAVRPRYPAPALQPSANKPAVLAPGPVPPGRWTTEHFVVPVAFSLPRSGWVLNGDTADQREVVSLTITDEPKASIEIEVPTAVFDAAGKGIPVRIPAQVIRSLQGNRDLAVGPVGHTTVAGTPALVVNARLRPSHRLAGFCIVEPCAPVWGDGPGTEVMDRTPARIAVLQRSGHTLAVVTSVPRHSRHKRQVAAVLSSLHFVEQH